MAGRITSLLDPSRIALHVQSTKRTAALNEIAKQLDGHPDVANYPAFYDELLARDRLDTTCLGNAVALPHARTEHVKKIVMAVGRADTGIPFDTNGEIVGSFTKFPSSRLPSVSQPGLTLCCRPKISVVRTHAE